MKNINWAKFPFDPNKWPFFYGWLILLWGTMGIIMSIPGQTIGVSVFTDPLIDSLKITRDELSFAYMIGTISSSFMLPWAGRKYDQYGARPVAITAAFGLSFILFILSKIDFVIFNVLKTNAAWVKVIIMISAFLLLRFFGQGVLTMTSRNMMMQWFDKRRGFATGFSNVIVALTFSGSPVFLDHLINIYDWKGAWVMLSLIAGGIFTVFVLTFFRNKPEDTGLKPDGTINSKKKKKRTPFPVIREYTLGEVRKNYAFWVIALMLAMQGLYITGFTFHVISIFEHSGLSEIDAITIFQPTAVIAVVVTLLTSSLSDYIQLKYLLYVKGVGACLGIIGVIFLGRWDVANELIIVGHGIMGGLFAVLTSVTWPRYFGRKNLGAVSGQATMMIVFGSALGPLLFSSSLSQIGSYTHAAWLCFLIFFILTIASVRANNPQIKSHHQQT
mgnify:CR=1 FL=1